MAFSYVSVALVEGVQQLCIFTFTACLLLSYLFISRTYWHDDVCLSVCDTVCCG